MFARSNAARLTWVDSEATSVLTELLRLVAVIRRVADSVCNCALRDVCTAAMAAGVLIVTGVVSADRLAAPWTTVERSEGTMLDRALENAADA